MDEPTELINPTVRGRDLPGAVKVMPLGLDAAIKKRASGEFKSEKSGSSLTFSKISSNQSSQQMQANQLPANGMTSQISANQLPANSMTSQISSNQMSSSMMSSSMTKQVSSSSTQQSFQSFGSSKTTVNQDFSTVQRGDTVHRADFDHRAAETRADIERRSDETAHREETGEIKQSGLKQQLTSVISEIESEIGQEFKENIPANIKSPTPGRPLSQQSKQDMFSPPPLGKHDFFSPPPLEPVPTKQGPHACWSSLEPVVSSHNEPQKSAEQQFGNAQTSFDACAEEEESDAFTSVGAPLQMMQNGFSEFSRNREVHQIQEQSSSSFSQTVQGPSLQESGSGSSLLQKIMTPAPVEFDSSSLKRRDPRKMFTDSSFYSAKHHPTVADQVEMAHRLSSAIFNRAQKNGGDVVDDVDQPRHDTVPNLKLVMNPEGKVHEWSDLDPSELPNAALMAGHAAPSLPSPDVNNPMVEDLNNSSGRGGELFAKRRKRAEKWIVDESSIGQNKPSAFADQFIQEQLTQQQQFHNQQAAEQAALNQQSDQQRLEAQQLINQEKQLAQQQFHQQQLSKQEQSLEIRRQQQLQETMISSELGSEIELPGTLTRTSLKARSFTPSLDLSCHNVQGINVWANTAPRGWAASKFGSRTTLPPTLSVCPATPSLELKLEQSSINCSQQQSSSFSQQSSSSIQQSSSSVQQSSSLQQQQSSSLQQQQSSSLQQQQSSSLQQAAALEQQQQQARMLQEQQEEQLRLEQQNQMDQQRLMEEQQRLLAEQQIMEQQRMEQQRMEQQRMEQQRVEQQRMEQQRAMEEQRMLEEQRIMREQEEQRRLEEQQIMIEQQRREEQQRIEQQQLMEQQRMEQQRMEQQRMEQQKMEHQRMEQQRMEQQRMEQQKMEQQRMEQQQMEQQRMEQQRMEQQRIEQQRMEHQRVEQEQQRIAGMETSQMSQQSLQHQETFSSSKSSHEVYEGTEFGSGVLKGYKLKEDALMNGGYEVVDGQQHQFLKDNGIFGGITGDHNSLVEEVDEVDYKRHSVKSLVGHFAKVKPKAEIPVQYLPEQRMYNGEQGPTLNYLSTKSESSSSAQSTLQRSTVSKQDSDVSRQEYEARKQASQQTVQNTQSSTSVSSSQKNSVEIRKKSSEMTEEQKQQLSQRRQSLKDYLLMDPAAEHAKAGIIDPSAILRGSEGDSRSKSEGILNQSNLQGESCNLSGKWDNHNTIARGWAGAKANYHPVTFRSIYNVDSQKDTNNL